MLEIVNWHYDSIDCQYIMYTVYWIWIGTPTGCKFGLSERTIKKPKNTAFYVPSFLIAQRFCRTMWPSARSNGTGRYRMDEGGH